MSAEQEKTTTSKTGVRSVMPNLSIRPMEPKDLEAVVALEQEVFPDPWSKDSFLHELTGNECSSLFVALDGERVIGYSVHWCFDIEAHISNFAVDNNYRRQFIGSFLLGYVISDILRKKIYKIYLELRSASEAAKSLYLKHGFEIDGTCPGYYIKDKDDAILMSLTLKEGP